MTDADINLLTLVGYDITLEEYRENVLDGYPPYYELEPLRFECTKCGKCCSRPGEIFMTPSDVYRIANHLKMEPDVFRKTLCARSGHEWIMKVTRRKACPFFVDDKCTIHSVKPIQCRTYPFWPEVVGTRAAWEAEVEDCEGIGRGREWTPDEIEALLVGLDATN